MQKPRFVNDEIYHIYNRGVEKRQIFMDDLDYFRFIHNLFEFNDTAPAGKFSEDKPPIVGKDKKREILVEILCFCLMPNHFHLILRQLKNKGIPNFMKKMGTGYSMFFNEKYERVGALFQGSYKAISVENDAYFMQLSRYIHLNPIELIDSNWMNDEVKNWPKTNRFLKNYRWSSCPDYIGKKNFPSVTSRDFLLDLFGGQDDYKKFLNQYLVDDFDNLKGFLIK